MPTSKKRQRDEGFEVDDYAAEDEAGGDSDDGSVDLPRPAGAMGKVAGLGKKKEKERRKKGKAVEANSFGEAMRTALLRHVPATSSTPILAGLKKNKALEQALEEDKVEKETAKLAVAKQKWFQKERVIPNVADKNREWMLLTIATKGTVQLFNAVQKQQKFRNEDKGRDVVPAKPDKITKGQFLDMLKGKGKPGGDAAASAGGKAIKRDDAEADGSDDEHSEEGDYEEQDGEEEGEEEWEDEDDESEAEIEEDSGEEEWND